MMLRVSSGLLLHEHHRHQHAVRKILKGHQRMHLMPARSHCQQSCWLCVCSIALYDWYQLKRITLPEQNWAARRLECLCYMSFQVALLSPCECAGILLALAAPEVDLLGISCVNGNVVSLLGPCCRGGLPLTTQLPLEPHQGSMDSS